MRIAEVIGTVTLSRPHPSLTGGRWRLVVPLTQDDLRKDATNIDPIPDTMLVASDGCSCREGDRVLIAESTEAAAPFHPEQKPVGAYIAAILDTIELDAAGAAVDG